MTRLTPQVFCTNPCENDRGGARRRSCHICLGNRRCTIKTILISTAAGCLALFLTAPVPAIDVLDVSYTTLDVSGAADTRAFGIEGDNVVGFYEDDFIHGFLAVIPEPATLLLLAVGMLMVCRKWRVSFS